MQHSAVAEHSGFSSPRHLGSVFQRELGTSPSQYRQQMQTFKSRSDGPQFRD